MQVKPYFQHSPEDTHMLAYGFFDPLTLSDIELLQKVSQNGNAPVLINVINSPACHLNVILREKIIRQWMINEKFDGDVIIIPPIVNPWKGGPFYYNSGDADEIKHKMKSGDLSWQSSVPSSVVELVEKYFNVDSQS